MQKLREKYPEYNDMPDQELAQRVIAKYPVYEDLLGDIAKQAPTEELSFEKAYALARRDEARQRAGKPSLGQVGQEAPSDLQQSMLAKIVRGAAHVATLTPPKALSFGERFVGPGYTERTQAALLRMAPGLVPNPLLSAPLSAAGEAAAQIVEGEPSIDPTQVALAAATPLAVAGSIRAARGGMRTATRAMPSLFERTQQRARVAGEEVVASLVARHEEAREFRPATDSTL